jgi:hypothetical protein
MLGDTDPIADSAESMSRRSSKYEFYSRNLAKPTLTEYLRHPPGLYR